MGDAVLNALTRHRQEAAHALTAAGLKAYDYVQEALNPPACVVVPMGPYVSGPVGQNPFGKPYSVRLQVLVIGGKGTNKAAAEQTDSMLIDVVNALDEDWDVTEVTEPQEVSVRGTKFLGAMVNIEKNISLEKEND